MAGTADDGQQVAITSETVEVNMGFRHTMATSGYSFSQMNFNQAGTK